MNEQIDNKTRMILEILEPHEKHITSVRNWERYARQCSLPSSSYLIKHFGSWNILKSYLGKTIAKKYSKEELLRIAEKHFEHFTTFNKWNEFATRSSLPVATTYMNQFGSWDDAKKCLNLPLSSSSWNKYSREEVIEIIKENSEHLTSKEKWTKFSKEHKLPDYRTIRNYFSWEKVQEIANVKINRYSEEMLLNIAKEHSSHFTSMKKWDEYAKANNLPLSMNYYRKFGSWNNVKARLFL